MLNLFGHHGLLKKAEEYQFSPMRLLRSPCQRTPLWCNFMFTVLFRVGSQNWVMISLVDT